MEGIESAYVEQLDMFAKILYTLCQEAVVKTVSSIHQQGFHLKKKHQRFNKIKSINYFFNEMENITVMKNSTLNLNRYT